MTSDKRIAEELLGAIAMMQNQSAPNPHVQESLANVQAMLAREDRGWEKLKGNGMDSPEGLSLPELKQWAEKLEEFAAAAGLGKRGFNLRHAFINEGGIRHDGVPNESRGRGINVQERINHPWNRKFFFGVEARRKRELRLYTAGLALWIGENATGRLTPVPLDQISGYLTHPDLPGVIMAWRRSWSRRKADGTHEDMIRWYFVDTFKSEETASIGYDGNRETVETGWTAFDQIANSFEGWPLGVPDALAGWIWAGIARDLYMDGVDVSSALATLAFKVTTSSKSGSQNAALQFATPQSAGGTAIMGVGSDLSFMSSASSGYQFSSIREVIALFATSIDVSTIHITSNAADAGSSYGSASNLDKPGRLTMAMRREEHVELEERVLRWMGAKDATAHYETYDDGTEIYRQLQAITLLWLQGTITETKYKELAAGILGVPDLGETPDGILIPNNEKSIARSDVDSEASPTGSTGSPTQGRGNGSGDTRAARDTRDDTIS